MEIDITGHHIEITPALKEHIETKSAKLKKHHQGSIALHVTLSVDKLEHLAEARLTVSGGVLFADAKGSDMYTTIDVVIDKVDRQLIRYKEKKTGH